MARLSLKLMLDELERIRSEYIGDELKALMRWQVRQGMNRGYALGFYLRRIILRHREVDAQEREAQARRRGKSKPESLQRIAEEAQG